MVSRCRAINVVLKIFDDDLFLPDKCWPEREFVQRVSARWAARELINELCVSNGDDAVPIITGYRNRMDEYASYDPGRGRSDVFVIARELANTVLTTLKMIEQERIFIYEHPKL